MNSPQLPSLGEKEAFLPNDIITTLSTIIDNHIQEGKHNFSLQQQKSRDQAPSKERKRPKFRAKFTKKKDMLESSASEEEDDANETREDQMPPISYFFIPYPLLLQKFQQHTGHGWTSYHLELFGALKTFLIKHSHTFLVHISSDRVGLVSSHDNPDQFLKPQYDGNGVRSFQSNDDHYLDNDTYRITSPHLYTHLAPTIPSHEQNQQLSTHQQHFQQYLALKSGDIRVSNFHPASESPRDSLESSYASISTINRTALSSRPQVKLNTVNSTTQQQSQPTKSQQTKPAAPRRTDFDHHDMEEKLRNRGCAPQAQSNLKLPILMVFFFLFLFIALGVLLHNDTIQPQQFGDSMSPIFRSMLAYQRFVKTFVRDFTGQ